MDAGAISKLQGASSHLNVFTLGARQRSNPRLADGLRNRRDSGKVTLRGHGKAGLDDVHAQILQGVRHGELFLRGHAAARRLLTIAQRGIEKYNLI